MVKEGHKPELIIIAGPNGSGIKDSFIMNGRKEQLTLILMKWPMKCLVTGTRKNLC